MAGDLEEALECYNKSLEWDYEDSKKVIYLKNIAEVYLKKRIP